jgi:hypothetical protein
MPDKDRKGKVYLVGAGPGDPELITLKGARCIARADVLIYDYLAARVLLSHARPDCECIYVGKKGGDHTLAQEKINALIVAKAQERQDRHPPERRRPIYLRTRRGRGRSARRQPESTSKSCPASRRPLRRRPMPASP